MASIFGNLWETDTKKKDQVTSARQDKMTTPSPREDAGTGASIFGDVFGARDKKVAEDTAGSNELMKVVRPLEYTSVDSVQKNEQAKAAEDPWYVKQAKGFFDGVWHGLIPAYEAQKRGAQVIVDAMNTDTGKRVMSGLAKDTSNLYSKYIAGIKADANVAKDIITGNARTLSQINKSYDDMYNAAYAARIAERNDPSNPAYQKFLENMGDSGVQSLVGAILSFGVGYLTKSPTAAYAVSAPFYASLSASEQIQKKGKVYSLGNIAIDTIGDELLNQALLGVFSKPASLLAKMGLESQVEGLTEVTQSILKYANDYRNATDETERDAILADAKKYVTNGDIVMEYLVGSATGLIAGGAVESYQAVQESDVKLQQAMAKYNEGIAAVQDNLKHNAAYATNLDQIVAEGSMPVDRVYQNAETKVLTQQLADGRVNDIAQNMERAGMPADMVKEFRGSIDTNNTTINQIVEKAQSALAGYLPPKSARFTIDNPQYVSQKDRVKLEEKRKPTEKKPVPVRVPVKEKVIEDRNEAATPSVQTDTTTVTTTATQQQDTPVTRTNEYSDLYGVRNVYVPNIQQNGAPIVSISTVAFPDGKFAVKYEANAGNTAMNVGWDYSKLYNSADEAVRAATNRIVLWAKTEQTSNLEPSVRSQLDAVIDYAQNPREPLSPAAIERIKKEQTAKKAATVQQDDTPIATPESEVEGLRKANPGLYNDAIAATSVEDFIVRVSKDAEVDAEVLRNFYTKVKPEFARAMQNANVQMYRAAMRAHTLEEFIADMRKKTGDKFSDADLEEAYHKIKGNQLGLALEKKTEDKKSRPSDLEKSSIVTRLTGDEFAGLGEGTKLLDSGTKEASAKNAAKVAVQKEMASRLVITPEDINGTIEKLSDGKNQFEQEAVKKEVKANVQLSSGKETRPQQLVTKTDVKNLLMGKDQIVFTVMKPDDRTTYLTYSDGKDMMRIKASALGLSDTNLVPFQEVVLDATELKKKGTAFRAVDSEGRVMAEKAKPTAEERARKQKLQDEKDYKEATNPKYSRIMLTYLRGRNGRRGDVSTYSIPKEDLLFYMDIIDGARAITKEGGVKMTGSTDVTGPGTWHLNTTPIRRQIEETTYEGPVTQDIRDSLIENQIHRIAEIEKETGKPVEPVKYDVQAEAQRLLDLASEADAYEVQGRDTKGRYTFKKAQQTSDDEYGMLAERISKAEPEGKEPSRFYSVEPSQESKLGPVEPQNTKALETPNTVDWNKEVDNLVRRRAIANTLAKKLNATVRYNKFRSQAYGIYKPKQNVVRLKTQLKSPHVGGQLSTLFHEIGHFIDFTAFKFRRTIPASEVDSLLVEYGNGPKSVPQAKKRAEAFAEFLRYYMTQPERAKKLAPEFYGTFEKLMVGYPEIYDAIKEARDNFTRWNEQPATAKTMAQISFSEDRAPAGERFTSAMHTSYSYLIDDLHAISEFTKATGKDIEASRNPYILARLLRGWIGRADTFLQTGTIGRHFWKDGKVEYKGKSLKSILEGVEQRGALKELSAYLVNRRAVELAGRNITTGIDPKLAEQSIAELEAKHGDFKKVAEELKKYQDDVMDYVIESGMVSGADAAKMRKLNEQYVPFYRVQEGMEGGPSYMGGKGIVNKKSLFKRIKGSEFEIIDPIESIIKNTYTLINAAERNHVLQAMANLAKENKAVAPLFERVPEDLALVAKVNPQDLAYQALGVSSDFEKSLLPPEMQMAIDEIPDTLVNIFRPSFAQKGNVVTVLNQGKRQHYVADTDLYKALNAMEVEDVALYAKIMSYPAQLLRAGATLTPEFMFRNPMRDTIDAAIYSRHGFLPFVDTVRGLYSLLKRDDMYQAWIISGGEQAALVATDRESMQQTKGELLSKKERAMKYVKSPLEILRALSGSMEAATRLGEARRALMRGKTPEEAAFSAREVTLDFMMSGAKTKTLNKVTAFLNAGIQANDKMIREFKDNPARVTAKAALLITLPAILLYLLNRQEPDWKDIPDWQKNTFFLFKVNGQWYRIPKPFLMGTLFGSVPERALEYMDTHDKSVVDGLAQAINQGAVPNLMPTFATPILENITNYSFFYDRPIVTEGMKHLPVEQQYTQNTSEVAKLSGHMIGASPAKIDNLIRGYFAGLGQYASDGIDKVLEKAGYAKTKTEPAATAADLPFLKAFVVRKPTGSAGKSLNTFYAKREEAASAYLYVKDLVESGRREEAQAYLQDHPEARLHSAYEAIARKLSDIRTARKEVYETDKLTAQQKREKVDKLDELSTTIADNALQMTLK